MRKLAYLVTTAAGMLVVLAGCTAQPRENSVTSAALKPVVNDAVESASATSVAEPDQPPADAAASIIVVAEASAPAVAAAPGGFPEVEMFTFTLLQFQRMYLLQDPDIHKELKLTAAQVQTFSAEGVQVKRLVSELQKAPDKHREAKLQNEFVPEARRFQVLIDRELTAAQQLQLLCRAVRTQHGAVALILPGVPEHLQLSDAQRTAICQIVENNRRNTKVETLNNPIELMKLLRVATQSRAAAEKHLTAQQRRQWDAMLGK